MTVNEIIPEEQKGNVSNCYGCIDQLLINSTILDDAKQNQKNLSLAWIDYQKAFDSVPQEWIVECLKMHNFDDITINFLRQTMDKWKTKLKFGNKEIERVTEEISINTGIFQGDCPSGTIFILCLLPLTWLLKRSKLGYRIKSSRGQTQVISHLFFMDDLKIYASNDNQLKNLISIVKMFSDDISMQFGLDKCSKVTTIKGKVTTTGGIPLDPLENEVIKELDNGQSYRYLGILENHKVLHKDMKSEIRNEYFKRLKKILKSELNSKNMMNAINTFAIPTLTYCFQILDWSLTELEQIERETRKQMKRNYTMNNNSNNNRIYLPRSLGGRGMLSIVDQYKKSTINMSIYLTEKINNPFLKLVNKWTNSKKDKGIHTRANKFCAEVNLTIDNIKEDKKDSRKTKLKYAFAKKRDELYKSMPLHGQLAKEQQQPYIDQKLSKIWLRDGKLKPSSEGTICAIQEQAITTNYIRKVYHKTVNTDTCRLCKQHPETIHHVVSGCPILADNAYTQRHDNIARLVHLRLAEGNGLIQPNKFQWYNYEPETVLENNDIKLLWNLQIHTDKRLKHNKPDLVLINKKMKSCKIIDIACPSDYNVIRKRTEKLQNYTDLAIEIRKLWKLNSVEIIPVIIGVTGTIYNGMIDDLQKLGTFVDLCILQRIALLGTVYVWRRFCELTKNS